MKKYEKYPTVNQDPEMDFEVTRSLFGRGECTYLGNKAVNGNILVLLYTQREGNEQVWDKGKYIGRKCQTDITVCGYRKTSILFGKRIQLVPEEEQEKIKSKLLEKLSQGVVKIESVSFW